MPSYLCISVRFLDSRFHGRGDGTKQEWPPSPLRLYQAMVAGCAMGNCLDQAKSGLTWLQDRRPLIVAPAAQETRGYVLSVPNNAMDLVAHAWSRGNYFGTGDADPATHRALKRVCPVRLEEGQAVHYLWPVDDPVQNEVVKLLAAARNVIALGWGIDMVVTYGQILRQDQVDSLAGERWLPVQGPAWCRLRVPASGTLDALERRHRAFLNRMRDGRFDPPDPLKAFDVVGYRRATDPATRRFAAFSLLKPDASGYRSFNTVRSGCVVAGMMRHAAGQAAIAAGWAEQDVNAFVFGHREPRGNGRHEPAGPRRFAYLPLPSLEARGEGRNLVVGSVRRVLVTTFADGCEQEILWARQTLAGHALVQEGDGRPQAILSLIPDSERMVRRYTAPAACWSTVTPVVLPGYDDRRGRKSESLLRKAIEQAGFSAELASFAQIEWRGSGYRRGVDLPSRYRVPEHLRNYPRVHVRIHWRDRNGEPVAVAGPACLGGGRFYGIGLFASDGEDGNERTRSPNA